MSLTRQLPKPSILDFSNQRSESCPKKSKKSINRKYYSTFRLSENIQQQSLKFCDFAIIRFFFLYKTVCDYLIINVFFSMFSSVGYFSSVCSFSFVGSISSVSFQSFDVFFSSVELFSSASSIYLPFLQSLSLLYLLWLTLYRKIILH